MLLVFVVVVVASTIFRVCYFITIWFLLLLLLLLVKHSLFSSLILIVGCFRTKIKKITFIPSHAHQHQCIYTDTHRPTVPCENRDEAMLERIFSEKTSHSKNNKAVRNVPNFKFHKSQQQQSTQHGYTLTVLYCRCRLAIARVARQLISIPMHEMN